jgi:hypothetical protein
MLCPVVMMREKKMRRNNRIRRDFENSKKQRRMVAKQKTAQENGAEFEVPKEQKRVRTEMLSRLSGNSVYYSYEEAQMLQRQRIIKRAQEKAPPKTILRKAKSNT